MMTKTPKSPPKNPTNSQLMGAINELSKAVEPVPQLVKDVNELMQEKRDRRIAEQAVDAYLKKNPKQQQQQQGSEQWLNRELLKTLVYALAIIAALVALLKTGTHQ